MKFLNCACPKKLCAACLSAICVFFVLVSCASVSLPDYFSYADGVMRSEVRGSVDGIDLQAVVSIGERASDGVCREVGIEYILPESLSGVRISRDAEGKCSVIFPQKNGEDSPMLREEALPEGILDGMLDLAEILAYDGDISSAVLVSDGVYEVTVSDGERELIYKTDTENGELLSVSGSFEGRRYDLKISDVKS